MHILVLNGSPRPKGNTKQMVEAFREGALASGHQVTIVDVCRKKSMAAWDANIAIPKPPENVFRRMICRMYIIF